MGPIKITKDDTKYHWCNNRAIGNHDSHPNKHRRHYRKPTVSLIYHLPSKPSNGCTLSVDTRSNWLGSKPSKRETTWAGQCWLNAMSKSTTPRQSKLQRGSEPNKKKCLVHQSKGSAIGNMRHLPPPRQEDAWLVHPNIHGMQNYVLQPNRQVPHPISLRQQVHHGYGGNW